MKGAAVTLFKLMSQKTELFKALRSRELKYNQVILSKDVSLYFDDVCSHIISMSQTLQHENEVLDESHSTFLARCDASLSRGSDSRDKMMKRVSQVFFSSLSFSNLLLIPFHQKQKHN